MLVLSLRIQEYIKIAKNIIVYYYIKICKKKTHMEFHECN